jgi:hypothetical protein
MGKKISTDVTMSTTPPGFFGFPEEESARRYRNTLIEVKKTIVSSKSIEELKMQMEHFLNINRHVTWQHHTSGVYRKDEAEKAVDKVLTEFERYITNLKRHIPNTSNQDLLDAIAIVESMLDRIDVR